MEEKMESRYPIRALVKAGSCSWPEEGVGDGSIIQVRDAGGGRFYSHDPKAPEYPFPWFDDEIIIDPSDSQIREQREKAGWNGDEPPPRPTSSRLPAARPAEASEAEPLVMTIVPGESGPEDLARIIEALADLYRLHGGRGLKISITPIQPEMKGEK